MAKLARVTQKQFASTAGSQQISQFGSLKDTVPIFSTDVTVIQALDNYLIGWYEAVIGANSPAIEDMNALFYVISYFQAYGFQAGIPEYDTGTTYYKGSLIQVPGYLFTVTSANATAGATYTNNGNTYTVMNTILAGTTLSVQGPNSPLSSGTLTKASGTGDATITFSDALSNTGIYASVIDTNLNQDISDLTKWTPIVPPRGLPFQRLATNSTGTKSEYTYNTITAQTQVEDFTVPVGYNKAVGFYTIPTGITETVAGSMTCVGVMKVPGTLIATGLVRIV